jgi:phage tail tape-measure protein
MSNETSETLDTLTAKTTKFLAKVDEKLANGTYENDAVFEKLYKYGTSLNTALDTLKKLTPEHKYTIEALQKSISDCIDPYLISEESDVE